MNKGIIKYMPCWKVHIYETAKGDHDSSSLLINILANDINDASSVAYKYALENKFKKPVINSIINTGDTFIEVEN